ncbi:hypothetical protein Tco_0461634 [Tanacetum coccineum]
MVEPKKPLKKKDQIALDEELALRMYAEEQAKLERMQKEKKSRMLVEMIAERKKFFAAQRAAEQRSKPPTKTQIRNRITDGKRKGTEDHTKEGSATQATQTPISTIFGDDETIAKVLLNMIKSESSFIEKRRKPLPKIDLKDKGKKKIEEEDESESESDGEEERNRIAEEKAANEALIRNFDDIKARIEADRLQQVGIKKQEREQYTLEKRSQNERLIKRMNEKGIDSSTSEVIKEESKDEVKEENKEEESPGKRKLGDSLLGHLKPHLNMILDRKYPIKEWKTECLGTKPQTDQAEHFEEINQNVVIRSNGQKRYFSTLMRVLSIFDREDLNAVYQLVMDRFQDEIPEGFDRVLWGDLMVMFNPDDENEFWNAQQDWNIVSWKLHGSSGVHTLVTETGLVIHMLVEKKYPLRKEVLMQMLKLKLESEEDSTMALELIRFIKKILAELEPEE